MRFRQKILPIHRNAYDVRYAKVTYQVYVKKLMGQFLKKTTFAIQIDNLAVETYVAAWCSLKLCRVLLNI